MAAKLGGSFIRCALGAVNYAGSCFQASRIADGLRELTPASLETGLRRGVDEAARSVGVPPREIERILPMGHFQGLLARIAGSQPRALAAWQMHAGQLGGLLAGVAELTVDGRAPDASLCLERLSKKVVRDRELSGPFEALAVDIANWEDLVKRCRSVLDDGGSFAKAYEKRRRRRLIMGASVVAIVASGIAVGAQIYRWRAHVEGVLATGDPCAVSALDADDLSKVSDALRAEVEAARAACDEGRRKDELALKAKQAQEAYVASCASLAKGVADGALSDDDAAFARDGGPLLARIAANALTEADLGPADPTFPCADTGAHAKLAASFAKAVVASPPSWITEGVLSGAARAALIAGKAELPPKALRDLDERSEADAKRAIVVGEASIVARAERLCGLAKDLGLASHTACAGVLAIAKNR